MNEPIEESTTEVVTKGGFREGSGRKPDWFKAKCRELACSNHFFRFAEKVFAGDFVDPKVTRTGIIYAEATVGDKVYLWDKLASYGFGKPETMLASSPLQSVANADVALRMLKMLQEVSLGNNTGASASGNTTSMDNGRPTPQTESPTTPSV